MGPDTEQPGYKKFDVAQPKSICTGIHKANQDIDVLMQHISERIGGKYRLTLICRYYGGDLEDADIMKSDDDFEKAITAMRRLIDRAPV